MEGITDGMMLGTCDGLIEGKLLGSNDGEPLGLLDSLVGVSEGEDDGD